mmetsp:Transcript_11761/g.34228  ORF Transcript_11761/g.34228 Transcript_11761/m.34228 type:complete len:235 (+) Transcript_11761:1562-2266(+)
MQPRWICIVLMLGSGGVLLSALRGLVRIVVALADPLWYRCRMAGKAEVSGDAQQSGPFSHVRPGGLLGEGDRDGLSAAFPEGVLCYGCACECRQHLHGPSEVHLAPMQRANAVQQMPPELLVRNGVMVWQEAHRAPQRDGHPPLPVSLARRTTVCRLPHVAQALAHLVVQKGDHVVRRLLLLLATPGRLADHQPRLEGAGELIEATIRVAKLAARQAGEQLVVCRFHGEDALGA